MQLEFTLNFEGKPDKDLEVVAYLFDRRGDLLASAPLKNGHVQFRLKEGTPGRLLLGPPAVREPGGTLAAGWLERRRAYEPNGRSTRRLPSTSWRRFPSSTGNGGGCAPAACAGAWSGR